MIVYFKWFFGLLYMVLAPVNYIHGCHQKDLLVMLFICGVAILPPITARLNIPRWVLIIALITGFFLIPATDPQSWKADHKGAVMQR